MNRAFFFDRDGVLNYPIYTYDSEYKRVMDCAPRNFSDLKINENAKQVINCVKDKGFIPVVITNQSIFLKNDILLRNYEDMTTKLCKELGLERSQIFECFHKPGFSLECKCRKPEPGLFLMAKGIYDLDLEHSWMIGDSEKDMVAADKAGIKNTIFLKRKGIKDKQVGNIKDLEKLTNKNLKPKYTINNIVEIIDILSKMKKILIVIPAYNEEELLEKNIIKLHGFLKQIIKNYDWEIIISDNDSIDSTLDIAKRLSKKYKRVSFRHQNKRPASYAIKKIWLEEDADIYMYMDADLSTDISHTPELIQGIEQGYNIVTGSRNANKSETSRLFHRFIVSMALIWMLKIFFWINITDFQCGFKAINRKVRDNIIPKMKALRVGFMDTEILVVANKKKYKIKEIPIRWNDTRESKNPMIGGIIDVLINMLRIKMNLLTGWYK